MSRFTHPARILVAEDDSEFRALIALTLETDGFEVIQAANGSALLDRLADSLVSRGMSGRFDMIISDVRMPEFSALDILVGLHEFLAQMPVVLMTAFGSRELHRRAQYLGASAVFDKPFDIDLLRDTVCCLLSQRAQQS